MPSRPSSKNDSRTSSVGSKRSSNSNNSGQRKRHKRNRVGKRNATDFAPAVQSPSELTDQLQNLNHSTDSSGPPAPLTDMTTDMGRNRLAAGFTRPPAATGPPPSAGESTESPIEISDDEEMDDSEGGMVINLQNQTEAVEDSSPDGTDDIESGEYSSSDPDTETAQPQRSPGEKNPAPSALSLSQQRLIDLDPAELEDQIKYAFYHLDRNQIDLNRPVLCLRCLSEGHLSSACDDKSQVIFPRPQLSPEVQVKYWISCCICASKAHLVGDCPRADQNSASRWSLASMNPSQIVNLSLETGTRKLELEAENRGMRPAGLQIKGRASRHTAGHGPRTDVESTDEEFIPSRRMRRQSPEQSARYDRFDPPSGPRNGGSGRGAWYATDSFGRRRSRSPENDQRHDRERRAPSPGLGGGDKWRPPVRGERQEPYSARFVDGPAKSDFNNGASKANSQLPRPNIQIQLPERRGSNTWNGGAMESGVSSLPTKPPPASTHNAPARKAKKARHRARKATGSSL